MKKSKNIAGVDEVGRGCLAGPVVSAAVIFKKRIKNKHFIKDSKKLSFKQRYKISKYIKKNAYFAVGVSSVEEINKFNILNATMLSMKRALKKLKKKPSLILIDGTSAPKGLKKVKTIIKGDEKNKVISAASIIAKVYRDILMIKLSKKYKWYRWEKNFGYGTKDHMKSLLKYGINRHHRIKFKPVHNMLFKKKIKH